MSAPESVVAGGARLRSDHRHQSIPRVIACCGGMVTVAGMERMTFEVLRVLRERGAEVHCIVNSWENHRIVALAEEVGASWSIGRYRRRLDRGARNPIGLAGMLWDIGVTSVGLLRDALRFRATHVLMPEFKSVIRNTPALAILRCTGVRVILRLGNPPEQSRFYRFVWRWFVEPFVDHFVCNSDFTRGELLSHAVAQRKVSRIYNTVPRRAVSGQEEIVRDLKRIIYVGQIIPAKGLDLLLDAVGVLVRTGEDVNLDIIGQIDGWVSPAYKGYREELLARARQADLIGRVTFLGYRDDVPALLGGAGIHCCPSRPEQLEGFGVVVIEAKAAGIPSVVFRSGALPELIEHGRDGWICEAVRAEALAEGLRYFLCEPERSASAGRAARASLSRFSREEFANGWLAAFGARQ